MAFTAPTIQQLIDAFPNERDKSALTLIIGSNAQLVDVYNVPENVKQLATLRLSVADIRFDAARRERTGDTQVEFDHSNIRKGILYELQVLANQLFRLAEDAEDGEDGSTGSTAPNTTIPNPTLDIERSGTTVSITINPGGDTVLIDAADKDDAGVLSSDLYTKLQNITTNDLATESELHQLESIVLTQTLVFGPALTPVQNRHLHAEYLGNLTVPLGKWRIVNNVSQTERGSEGQRNSVTIPAGALDGLFAIPDSEFELAGLSESNQRYVLENFISSAEEPNGLADLWIGRTTSNRIVIQSSGRGSTEDLNLSVYELEPKRITTNNDIRLVSGTLIQNANWSGGSATYDEENQQLTIRVSTSGNGSETAVTVGAVQPSNPTDGDIWSDTGTNTLQVYDATSRTWITPSGGAGATRSQVYDLVKQIFANSTSATIEKDDNAETVEIDVQFPTDGVSVQDIVNQIHEDVKPFAIKSTGASIERDDLTANQRLPVGESGKILEWVSDGDGGFVLGNTDKPSPSVAPVIPPSGLLTAAQRAAINDSVQIDGISFSYTDSGTGIITFTSEGGDTHTVMLPGFTVEDETQTLGTERTVSALDFTGSGVTATRAGNKVTVTIPGVDANITNYELEAHATLPAVANHSVGDIVNYNGTLFIVVDDSATGNLMAGTAGRTTTTPYRYGVVDISGISKVGSFHDPGQMGEFTWKGYNPDTDNFYDDNDTSARLRLPKTYWTGAPNNKLYGRVASPHGYADFEFSRDSARDTSTYWAYATVGGGENLEIITGQDFNLYLYTDIRYSTEFSFHGSNYWHKLSIGIDAQRSDDRVEELARDAVGVALSDANADTDTDVTTTVEDTDNKIKLAIKDDAVTPSKLDAGTSGKKTAIRDRIGASAPYTGGTGITITGQSIALTDPQARVSGALSAQDTYDQAALDASKDYKIEAVEKDGSTYNFRSVDADQIKSLSREQHVVSITGETPGELGIENKADDGTETTQVISFPGTDYDATELPDTQLTPIGTRRNLTARFTDSLDPPTTFEPGEYKLNTERVWEPTGYTSPAGALEHDFKVLVEETVPGRFNTKQILFPSDQSPGATANLFIANNPFDNVLSVRYDARPGTADENRYVVSFNPTVAVGGGIPKLIIFGTGLQTVRYPLTLYGAPTETLVTYRTPEIGDNRYKVTNTQLVQHIDIQYQDGSWANGTDQKLVTRTYDKELLSHATKTIQEVLSLPANPSDTQRVKLIHQDVLSGYGLLVAGEDPNSFYWGYTQTPSVGSLDNAPANLVSGLVTYNGAPRAELQYKTVWIKSPQESRTPATVTINGTEYGVTATVVGSNTLYILNDAPVDLIMFGSTYKVQFAFTNGDTLFPTRSYPIGDYTYDGLSWVPTPGQWSQDQITSWFAAWAQQDNTERIPISKLPFIVLTQAEYDALVASVAVDASIVYLIT